MKKKQAAEKPDRHKKKRKNEAGADLCGAEKACGVKTHACRNE